MLMLGLERGDIVKSFLVVQGLLELEKAEKWDQAKTLLYNLWYSDKGNVDKLCRVIAECWFVLTEWNCCIQNSTLSFASFKETLIEVMQYGIKHFPSDANFLCMSGYMISLFPDFFYRDNSDEQYSKWEQKGNDMLRLATHIAPNNLICKILYLGTQPNALKEYLKAKIELAPRINSIFSGHTAVEDYFKDILSN